MRKKGYKPNAKLLFGVLLLLVMFFETREVYSFIKPVISVSGKVLELGSEKGVDSNIEVKDADGKIVFRTRSFAIKEGKFYITGLKPNSEYWVYISSSGYEQKKELLPTPPTDRFIELKYNFELIPNK